MDQKIWKKPIEERSLDQSEVPFWFWNNKLEKDEILRQLKLMTEKGIRSNMPHGRGMSLGNYIGGYLDDGWMEHMKTVLDYKEKEGESAWIYDEMDWPAGTCNKSLTKEEGNREQFLTFHRVEVKGGEEFSCQLFTVTGEATFGMTAENLGGKTLNVFLFDQQSGHKLELKPWLNTLYMDKTPLLSLLFRPEKDAVVYLVKVNIEPYKGMGSNWINYLDKRVTDQFLESTYEKYYEKFPEQFGGVIKAFFNDETRMANAFVWSDDFPEEFQKRKGYDLLPKITDIIIPGDEAGRTRCDYFDVVAALYSENYIGRISEWCFQHNVSLAAHLLGEETLAGQVRFNGDFMRQFEKLTLPGVDHLGKGIGSLNAKFGTGAAHSYGRQNVTVEMFAGCGWDLSYEEYTKMICWMFQQGIQTIINHAFFYSIEGERAKDWPPSQFFQWKHWDKMKEGNELIRRLAYSLSEGIPESEVLIYVPTETYWLHYLADENFTHGYMRGAFVKDKRAALIDREIQVLLTGLAEKNISYDLLHKEAIKNFRTKDKKIINALTQQEFKVLILPYCEVLSIEAARLAKEFAKQGGTVIALDCIPNYTMPQEADTELRTIFNELVQSGSIKLLPLKRISNDIVVQKIRTTDETLYLEELIDKLNQLAPSPIRILEGTADNVIRKHFYEPAIIDPYIHTGEDITGISFYRYLKDGKRNTFIMNYSDREEKLEIELSYDMQENAQLWNPFTGEIQSIVLEARRFKLTLEPNRGIILVTE